MTRDKGGIYLGPVRSGGGGDGPGAAAKRRFPSGMTNKRGMANSGRSGGGGEGRQGGGLLLEGSGGGSFGIVDFVFVVPALAHGFGTGEFGLGEVGDGGEGAVFGVVGDFFDEGAGGRFGGGAGREVVAGDLETVKKEAGAAGLELAGGDVAEDLADGKLDGGTVFREWELEGDVGAGAGEAGGRNAGGAVEVAEVFIWGGRVV